MADDPSRQEIERENAQADPSHDERECPANVKAREKDGDLPDE
jgi:hypothetical protein